MDAVEALERFPGAGSANNIRKQVRRLQPHLTTKRERILNWDETQCSVDTANQGSGAPNQFVFIDPDLPRGDRSSKSSMKKTLPKPKPRPKHLSEYSDNVAALVEKGISHSNNWITLGAVPGNCDEILDAWATRRGNEESAASKGSEDKRAARRLLKEKTTAILIKCDGDVSKCTQADLALLVKYKMKSGFSAIKEIQRAQGKP
jgi:hypothetical protein